MVAEGWVAAVAKIVGLIEGSKGAIFDIAQSSHEVCGLATSGHDPAAQQEYTEHYYAIDPTFKQALAQQPHHARTAHGTFSPTFRARSEYFQFARKIDIGDAIGILCRPERGKFSVMTVQRPYGAPDFSAEPMRIGTLLTPHVELAKRVENRLAEAAGQTRALAAGLDRLAHAAFIVDGDGLILHMNGAAEALLRRDSRLRAVHGRLQVDLPGSRARFDAALKGAACEGGRSTLFALPARKAYEVSEVVVAPLAGSNGTARDWQRPLALVVIPVSVRDPEHIARRMRRLYGLTDAEARVVTLLAKGYSLHEIAFARGVRYATLRSQLQTIFAKVGVTRQANLVRIALGGAPLTPDS